MRSTRFCSSWGTGFLCLALLTGCKSGGMFQAWKMPSMSSESSSRITPGSGEFSTSKKLKDPSSTFLAYARWQEQANQSNDARNSYQEVLDRNPKSIEALLGMSRLEQLAGRQEEAEKFLLKAQKLGPNDATVAAAFGLYYANQKDWARAKSHLEQARIKHPDDKVIDYQLGVVLVKSGDTIGGLKEFQRCQGPAEASYNVGFLLQEMGQYAEAEAYLTRACELKPDLKQAQSALASVQEQQGFKPGRPRSKPTISGSGPAIQPAGGAMENAWSSPAAVGVQPAGHSAAANGRQYFGGVEATVPLR